MALQVPEGVILIWDGAEGDIPTGWKRVATLDEKYPKGYGAEAVNTTGGATTHDHAATADHAHLMNNHSHNYTLSEVSSPQQDSPADGTELTPGKHSHSGSIGGTSGGTLTAAPATYDSVSNDPPFMEVIFIEPDGAPADLSDDIIAFTNLTAAPSGWGICNGQAGTFDLNNIYPKGAAAADDSGVTGGSVTNVHPLTHTHVEQGHTHSGVTSGTISPGGNRRGQAGTNSVAAWHVHAISLNSTTAGGISSETLTTPETVEPSYRKLLAIKNLSGAASQPRYLIAMWLGSEGSIPAGWIKCDGNNGTPNMTDRFVKMTSEAAQVAIAGGSATHTHASQTHTHTGNSHSHSGAVTSNHSDLSQRGNSTGGDRDKQNVDPSGGHSWTSVSSVAASWQAASTAADSANNEPPYRTVIFIQFVGTVTNDERDAEVTGQIAQSSIRGAEVLGIDPGEERRAEVSGKQLLASVRNAEISGKIRWTPEEERTVG